MPGGSGEVAARSYDDVPITAAVFVCHIMERGDEFG